MQAGIQHKPASTFAWINGSHKPEKPKRKLLTSKLLHCPCNYYFGIPKQPCMGGT
jgi:hypothetical protein